MSHQWGLGCTFSCHIQGPGKIESQATAGHQCKAGRFLIGRLLCKNDMRWHLGIIHWFHMNSPLSPPVSSVNMQRDRTHPDRVDCQAPKLRQPRYMVWLGWGAKAEAGPWKASHESSSAPKGPRAKQIQKSLEPGSSSDPSPSFWISFCLDWSHHVYHHFPIQYNSIHP